MYFEVRRPCPSTVCQGRFWTVMEDNFLRSGVHLDYDKKENQGLEP